MLVLVLVVDVTFRKVVRQHITYLRGVVVLIPPFSQILSEFNSENCENLSTFTEVIIKIKVARVF